MTIQNNEIDEKNHNSSAKPDDFSNNDTNLRSKLIKNIENANDYDFPAEKSSEIHREVLDHTLGSNKNIFLKNRPKNISRTIKTTQISKNRFVTEDTIVIETDPDPSRIASMVFSILFTILIFQIAFYFWKRAHKKTADIFSFFVILILPIFFSVIFKFLTIFYALVFLICGKILHLKSNPKTSGKGYRLLQKVFGVLSIFCYTFLFFGIISFLFSLKCFIPLLSCFIAFLLASLLLKESLEFSNKFYKLNVIEKTHGENDTCLMCRESVKDVRNIVLKCGHIYHSLCLKGYLSLREIQDCPCCKKKMNKEVLNSQFFDKFDNFFKKMMDIAKNFVIVIFLALIFSSFHVFG